MSKNVNVKKVDTPTNCISRQQFEYKDALKNLSIEALYAIYEEYEDALKILLEKESEDCISRQAAINAIEDINAIVRPISESDDVFLIDKAEAMTELMMLPFAQPERPKGKWVDMSDGGRIKYIWYEKYMCNKCGERGTNAWSFCPNCGADMRGSTENE